MAEQKKKADLETLDLATGVDRIPEWWNKHGNKVLVGFTILALSYALWTYKRNTDTAARVQTEANLVLARETLSELRTTPLQLYPPDAYANLRRQAFTSASTALSDVLGKGGDDATTLQALLLQADLFYTLGMLPDPAEATTRPALRLERTPEQLFNTARDSYQAVLDRYPNAPLERATAKLGLAAIAENVSDFDTARKHYDALAQDAATPQTYRDHAKTRLDLLPDLAKPLQLRPPTPTPAPPTTAPTTQP